MPSSNSGRRPVKRVRTVHPALGPIRRISADLTPPAATNPTLHQESVERLQRFLKRHADKCGRLAGETLPAEADATLPPKPRLDWSGRGTFHVPADGGEWFLHPSASAALHRALDRFIRAELPPYSAADSSIECMQHCLGQAAALREAGAEAIARWVEAHDDHLRAWLRPPLIRETHYCITLDLVPEEFYVEIAASKDQHSEWVRLYGIDLIEAGPGRAGYSEPLTIEFLRENPYLMLDTRFLPRPLIARLLDGLDNLDEQLDGLLVHGDNFRAMRLLEPRYRQAIDCIYTDPPYNTGGRSLPYPDRYTRSDWLTMMDNRLRAAYRWLKPGAACWISIDENEQAALELLLADIFRPEEFVATLIWEAGRKNDSKLISVSHEYMLCYVKGLGDPPHRRLRWRVRKDGIDEIDAKARVLVRQCRKDYRQASRRLRHWLAGLPDNHPAKRHRHYCCVDERGVYHPGNISWPGGGGPTYEVVHPVTRRPCKVPSRGWMYPSAERMAEAIAGGLVHFGDDETRVPCAKVYLHANEHHAPNSVFYRDGRAAMKRLRDILGGERFANPKDERIIAERLAFSAPKNATVLDLFAGSGAAAHAVIDLNRRDAGRRRYVLMEMGDSFDAVLRTRIQRIVYSQCWKRGRPLDRDGVSHAFKYIRLSPFAGCANQAGVPPEAFTDPTGAAAAGLDLIETFNHLLGLRVRRIHAHDRATMRAVEATAPNGDGVLVVWQTGSRSPRARRERLSAWSRANRGMLARARIVYLNGPLEGIDHPRLESIEAEFGRRMASLSQVQCPEVIAGG